MKPILGYFSTQVAKTGTVRRAKAFIRRSLLFLTLGVGALIGASSLNQIPILIIANAQPEDTEELREEQGAREIEEEFSSEQGVDQDDKNAGEPTSGSNRLSLTLEQAHFIPLSPLSDSPGNQVKMLLDYIIDDPATLADDSVSAIMEVYAENQTCWR